jgi:hypothetical protein
VKKALLIVAGLMAINLPVNAAQVAQVNADEVNVSQQTQPIQTETNLCKRTHRGVYCW